MNRMALYISLSCVITACSTAPKPPVVDGDNRVPINNSKVLEKLQRDLNRGQGNVVSTFKIEERSKSFTINFAFNSVVFNPADIKSDLLSTAGKAKRIQIRGRTDGKGPRAGDEYVAINRALAAKDYLINHGISSQIITINYTSAGDYVADNKTWEGRAKNRRVEIECFYN